MEHTPFSDQLASRIYPYLVTGGYPDCLSTATQQQRRLGHDLSIALVVPQRVGASDSDAVASVGATQLAAEGSDLDAAYAHADANLSAALSSGQIVVQRFDHGPAGVPTVAFSGSWLAATTLVAPSLHEKMTRLLGGDVVAAVPHRELLLVFPAAVHRRHGRGDRRRIPPCATSFDDGIVHTRRARRGATALSRGRTEPNTGATKGTRR